MERYIRGQDEFAEVLRRIQPDQWDNPSPCAGWTARDVAGHVIWGLDMVRARATGAEFDRVGAPGAPHPGDYLGPDPLADWERKREPCLAALTPEAMERTVTIGPLGDIPMRRFLDGLAVDFLAHAWDLGAAAGAEVRLDPEMVEFGLRWADKSMEYLRGPALFGPALPTPADADPQTRLIRLLGRAA